MKRAFLYKSIIIDLIIALNVVVAFGQNSPTFESGQDPKPDGKKWVKVEILSDEFDGETLNETKWKNTDPAKWLGRVPAIFKQDVANVAEGNLNLTVYKLEEPEVVNGKTWTHAGGYVASQNPAQVGYYFEAKMKASQTFMSSTFWVINNRNEGEACDKRVTELDIQECIGQITTDAGWAQNKDREMGSNTHSRNTSCPDTPVGSKGNYADIGEAAYNDYHIYAAWWKSATEILFFLDGKYVYTVQPEADFNLPMYLRMVSETYDWNPVPADGGMTGTTEERTTSYDWVRTWKLENDVTGADQQMKTEKLQIYPNPVKAKLSISGITSGFTYGTIFSMTGQVIKVIKSDAGKHTMVFDVSELPKGTYLLHVDNNSSKQVLKFVKS